MVKIYFYISLFLSMTASTPSMTRYELPCCSALPYRVLDVARLEVGVKEATNRNDGEVEKYLKAVGLGKGYPYCMAGVYWCFKKASGDTVEICIPQTASANAPFNYAKKHGYKTALKPVQGDLIVWRKINSWSGHIGIIEEVHRFGWVWTIEFNTSSGRKGSQRDGGGVYRRKRNIYHPLGRMQVRGFIGFRS